MYRRAPGRHRLSAASATMRTLTRLPKATLTDDTPRGIVMVDERVVFVSNTISDPAIIKDLTARLKRIEGQARGIQRMLEEGRPCEDIVTQLSALRNAVDKVATHVILENLEACILSDNPAIDPKDAIREAKRLILRL